MTNSASHANHDARPGRTPGELGAQAARAAGREEDARFRGCVHDAADADLGHNPAGERVVRIDLAYTRGPAAVTTTSILTLDAAIALRNQLDGLFDAAGIEDADADAGRRSADGSDLLRFAKAYAGLGHAVSRQVEDLLAGRYDELNPNAAALIRERLGGTSGELDDALNAYDERILVDDGDACPNCGERRQDLLVWIENSPVGNEVQCETCGLVYRLSHAPPQ